MLEGRSEGISQCYHLFGFFDCGSSLGKYLIHALESGILPIHTSHI